jgi:membrane fusion protein, heavy metal efflux system
MKNILLYAVLFTFGILTACKQNTAEKDAEKTVAAPDSSSTKTDSLPTLELQKAQLELMQIGIGTASMRPMTATVEANGKVIVLANSVADVSALMRGRVERFFVKEGQSVKAGQAILELIAPDMIALQEDFARATSELNFQNQELERQQTLNDNNAGAKRNLQETQNKVRLQQAIIASTTAKLKLANFDPTMNHDGIIRQNIVVKAPISGYLDHFPVNLGAMVMEGAKLARIVNLDHLHADIFVYEKDLQYIKEKQKVRLRFADSAIPEAIGVVEYIGREVDMTNRTVALHVEFNAPKGRTIVPEMQLKAAIETQNATMFCLPESAVLQDENKFFYFVVAEKTGDKTTFEQVFFVPKGSAGGYIGISEKPKGDIVTKNANILWGELKRAEMSE